MAINDPTTYYTLDSATTITDSGSGSNPGTPNNSPTSGPGKVGNAVILNGSNQSILVPSAAMSAIATGDFTIAMWVNISAFSSYGIILDSTSLALMWAIDSATHMYFYFAGGAGGDQTSSATFTTGGWHHIAWTRLAGTGKIYVDGAVAISFGGTFPNLGAVGDTRIGYGGHGGSFLNGSVDEFRIYTHGMTSTDIANLMALGASSAKPWIYAQAMHRLRRAA